MSAPNPQRDSNSDSSTNQYSISSKNTIDNHLGPPFAFGSQGNLRRFGLQLPDYSTSETHQRSGIPRAWRLHGTLHLKQP
jgi:hypothetical protein